MPKLRKKDLKVGAKYRVRQWDDMAAEYGLDSYGSIRVPATFTKSMRQYCGMAVVYRKDLNLDMRQQLGSDWVWTVQMFEPAERKVRW